MKRSQMILEIVAQLQDYDKNYNRISFSEWKQKAEKVLTLIENSGMKPPSYQLRSKGKGAGGAVATTRIDGQWEPEDELTDAELVKKSF